MNFFEQQDQARKNTRLLLLLFFISLVCIVVLANLLLVFVPFNVPTELYDVKGASAFFNCMSSDNCQLSEHIPWNKIAFISIAIVTIILLASGYKSLSLTRSGGEKIATLLGGEPLAVDSTELLDKRLFNVVQEMSLAANMAPPKIYVLRHEEGINAFAAGYSNNDAVIAVTQGLLESLSRDQLQGVVAHEFSHIVHGDCSLNMRLLSIVFGLLFLSEIGFFMLRLTGWGRHRRGYSRRRTSKRDGRTVAAFAAAGVALIVVGYIGVFFGNLIKSAVSRQREYLADASAVKYTRQPESIADALKIILSKGGSSKGSYVEDAHASEMSHFFFSKSVNQLQSIFASHPKLVDRIYRVEPQWDGSTTTKNMVSDVRRKAQAHAKAKKSAEKAEKKSAQDFAFDLEASPLVAALMLADEYEEQQLSAAVASGAETTAGEPLNQKSLALLKLKPLFSKPIASAAVILELLISLQFSKLSASEKELRVTALRTLINKHWPALSSTWEVVEALDLLDAVDQDSLKLVELCIPALRQLSNGEYLLFKKLLTHTIKSDGQVDLLEWCIHQFVIGLLDVSFEFKKEKSAKYKNPQQLQQPIAVLLHLLIGSSSQDDTGKNKTFTKSCDSLGLYAQSTQLPNWQALPSLKEFSKANIELKLSYSLLKGKLINVCKNAVIADGVIDNIERQILLSLAASWEIPMPDTLLDNLNLVSAKA